MRATTKAGLCVCGLLALRGAAALAAERDEAEAIFKMTEFRGGLIVHLGSGDGRLTAALAAGRNALIQGLDRDEQDVEEARRHLVSLGLYGRASVVRWTGERLPYADNLVNLLVVGGPGDPPREEVLRALAPRGTACVKEGGRWTTLAKPWPEDMDEWTHWLHGADGNAVARDRRVGPPAHVQWVESPLWQRHHELNASTAAMVSARGRVFTISDEAPATVAGPPGHWSLIARDGFNGVLLWKRPMADWGWRQWSTIEAGGRWNMPIHIARRVVAAGDRVYVTLGFNAPLSALDAATGEVVKTYEGTAFTDEIAFHDGVLVLAVSKAPQQPGRIAKDPPVKKEIVALNADTGEILWRRGDYAGIAASSNVLERLTHLSPAVGGGRVVFLEEDAVVCLDLRTGRPLWRSPRENTDVKAGHVPYRPANLCTLIALDRVILYCQPEEAYTTRTWNRGVRARLTGLSPETGEPLWAQECAKWGPGVEGDVFFIGGLVWTHAAEGCEMIGIEPESGEVRRRLSVKAAFSETHHHRCYRNKATERYFLTGRRGIEAIDLASGAIVKNHWVRGTCRYGIMPANGLIYVPPHPCECYIRDKLSGFYALAARPLEASAAPATSDAPAILEKGPAYDALAASTVGAGASADWPTFRGDTRRSGASAAEVPAQDLKRLWQADLGGRLSACTAGRGVVFAAAVDAHTVHALRAADGERLWSYTAGGRIDTPPTISGDRALFGSADGWVYCLRASDGALAWRFRVAPAERTVVAFGQLESAWPVHGTVLITAVPDAKDTPVAVVAAGRSTHLDGGIRVCALDVQTGRLLRDLETLNRDQTGLEDVLVTGGDLIWMRHLKYTLAPEAMADRIRKESRADAAAPRAYSTAGLLDPSDFSRVGWPIPGQTGQAELLVFNDRLVCAFQTKRSGGFGGWYRLGAGACRLTAFQTGVKGVKWSVPIPMHVEAMALTGADPLRGVVFVAGPPDAAESSDPWAALEGRAGGILRAVATADGATLAEYRLDSPPVRDGLSAAAGRLYLSTAAGHILCFSSPGEPTRQD